MSKSTNNTPRFLTRESTIIVVEGNEYSGVPGHHHLSGPSWKLDVGAQCNAALNLAEQIHVGDWTAAADTLVPDAETAETIESLVARVAAFEDLESEE